MKTFLISWAQNATRVHPKFWASMQQFKRATGAELQIIGGRYKNPTSRAEARVSDDEDVWCDEVTPHLIKRRRSLCPNLRVYSDISIQPTASRPLSGFEVFMGRNSGIFGHPKRAFEVVPTSTRNPRGMWSTGACTVKNYSDSKAGKKGQAHHVLGALVVQVDDDGTFFVRHVTAARDGSFTDLGTRYTPTGHAKAPRALTVTLGDWHSGQVDPEALEGTRELVQEVRPKFVVGHDWLDFRARNHHDRSMRHLFSKRFDSVEREVKEAAEDARMVSRWGDHVLVLVRSNHDEALERWVDEADPRRDPVNAPYWHELNAVQLRFHEKHGHYPDLFALECRRHGVLEKVRFLKRNESFKVADVEHGFHGDKGANGARGTAIGYAKLGVKVNRGHEHAPSVRDGVFTSGCMNVDQGYNLIPSSWLVAHTVLHADGKRQLIVVIKGRYKGGQL
jgi:hypothetical protein